MRSLGRFTKCVTGAVLALLMAMLVVGCAESDEFEYMKDERQMMRHGEYGPGMSDADKRWRGALDPRAAAASGSRRPGPATERAGRPVPATVARQA